MPLQELIASIAEASARADANDLPALVELHDLLSSLAESEDATDEALVGLSSQAAERVQSIVLRETETIEDDLAWITDTVAQIQSMVDGAAPADMPTIEPSSDEPGTETDVAAKDASEPPAPEDATAFDAPEDAEASSFEGDEELLEAWIPTAGDALNDIEGLLLALAEQPSDDDVAELRRIVHTIKGECGVVSAHHAQHVFHEAETAIDRATEAGLPLPTDELFGVLDWARKDVDAIAGTPTREIEIDAALMESLAHAHERASAPAPIAPSPSIEAPVELNCQVDDTVHEFVGEAKEHIAAAEEALLTLETTQDDPELINTVFRAFHTIKGVAGLLNIQPIVDVAHEAEFLLDMARNGDIVPSPPFLHLCFAACDMLAELISQLEGGPAPKRAKLDDLVARLKSAREGDIHPPEKSVTTEPSPASPESQSENDEAPKAPAQQQQRRADLSVKVNTRRLDSLLDMVGELVIGQQMIVQDPHIDAIQDQRTVRNLAQTSKIIRDLQEVAMSLRMVTLRGTFQKMARLVRDLAAKSGKEIAFHIEGEDTELDRNVVEEIGDPLVHMVRNACDHGIEPPEERVAAGKPEQGNLTLRAMHRGGSIVIELEDDGRGLRREKILKKAIEREIIPSDRDPDELSDAEVYNLIFAAGFSTADKVTDISGRGVGMDVVRRNIEALRGKVEIKSAPGTGSTFVLSLPLTMAIIDGMIVRVGSQRYVVPTLSIEQSFRPAPEEISTTMGRGEAVLVRGALLPVYRLNRMFDLDEGANSFDDSLLMVVEFNDQRCCLLVDELLGQQQVVIKSLGGGIARLPGVSGGAILGDGRVALILDVAGLFQMAEHQPALAKAS